MNNAFLVHKPGVKKKKIQNIKFKDQKAKNEKILRGIEKELIKMYGRNKQCTVLYKWRVSTSLWLFGIIKIRVGYRKIHFG